MTAETYLKQHTKLSARIRRIQEAIEETRAAAEYPGIKISDMPRSPSHSNTQEDKLIRLATLEEDLMRIVTEDTEIIYDIENTINELEDDTQAEVLHLRYIKNIPLVNFYGQSVADKMGYSESHIYKLHRDGIAAVQDILDKKYSIS